MRKTNLIDYGKLPSFVIALVTIVSVTGVTFDCEAQWTEVQVNMRARALNGVVTDPSGTPVQNVQVTLHTCALDPKGGFKMGEEILAQTMTDAKGSFTIPKKL